MISIVAVLSFLKMDVKYFYSISNLYATADSLANMENDVKAAEVSNILSADNSFYRTEVKGAYERAEVNRIFAIGQNITSSYPSVNNAI